MVDVRDLAEGMALLVNNGESNEKYLLVGNYHTQLGILTSLSRILKLRPPSFVISSKVVMLALPFLAISDSLAKTHPKLTMTMAVNGLSPAYFTNMKSKNILSWTPQYSLDESLIEAVKYYQEVAK